MWPRAGRVEPGRREKAHHFERPLRPAGEIDPAWEVSDVALFAHGTAGDVAAVLLRCGDHLTRRPDRRDAERLEPGSLIGGAPDAFVEALAQQGIERLVLIRRDLIGLARGEQNLFDPRADPARQPSAAADPERPQHAIERARHRLQCRPAPAGVAGEVDQYHLAVEAGEV